MGADYRAGLLLVSRSMPPDVGGYQRQFRLLLPYLGVAFGGVVWIGAIRDVPAAQPKELSGARIVGLPAHRLPRCIRGVADLGVVLMALVALLVLRSRRGSPRALLLLSPTMLGGAWLVRTANALGWSTSTRFPSEGDQVHRRGHAVGCATSHANVVPSMAQQAEQRDFGVTVVPNAVEVLSGFKRPPSAETGTFLFLGRLVERKRPDLILDSWARIEADLPGWRLVFAGGGGEQRDSVEGALRRRLTDDPVPRCELRGFQADPLRVLREADILVFPSLSEGLPNAVLEAMAAGVPTLADPVLAREWFGREVPLLDWDGTCGSLAAAMRSAARAVRTRLEVAEQGRAFVAAHHDPATIASRLTDQLKGAGASVLRSCGAP